MTLRGGDRIAILDVKRAVKQTSGVDAGAAVGFVDKAASCT